MFMNNASPNNKYSRGGALGCPIDINSIKRIARLCEEASSSIKTSFTAMIESQTSMLDVYVSEIKEGRVLIFSSEDSALWTIKNLFLKRTKREDNTFMGMPPHWFHSNMLRELSDIEDRARWTLPKNRTPIIFAGHSVGGAIASIAAMGASFRGLNVKSVITFGAPAFLTTDGQKEYLLTDCTSRFVNHMDHVCATPFGAKHGVFPINLMSHRQTIFSSLPWNFYEEIHSIHEYIRRLPI
jgi:hypothetical protein